MQRAYAALGLTYCNQSSAQVQGQGPAQQNPPGTQQLRNMNALGMEKWTSYLCAAVSISVYEPWGHLFIFKVLTRWTRCQETWVPLPQTRVDCTLTLLYLPHYTSEQVTLSNNSQKSNLQFLLLLLFLFLFYKTIFPHFSVCLAVNWWQMA